MAPSAPPAAAKIVGIGPASLIPTLQLGSGPAGAMPTISPEEGFLLSRVDGRTSLGDLCLLVPFPRVQTEAMLLRLWQEGVLVIAGIAPYKIPMAAMPQPPRESVGKPIAAPAKPAPAAHTDDSSAADPIGATNRARIDEFFAALDQKDAFALLEIDRAADDKSIRRAYFRLSKEFHPDRYFGKPIGEYKDRLSAIFRAVKSAHELLENKERRAAYVESLPR